MPPNPHHRPQGAEQPQGGSGEQPHPFDQKWVYYNDGQNKDCHALVLVDKKSGDTLLDLYMLEGLRAGQIQRDVPRREEPYGPEGGGVTWHL